MEIQNDEIIQIHIGHAGVELANPCWELYSGEHDIQDDGIIKSGLEADNPFYSCSETGNIMSRSILIDTEKSAIDDVRFGPHRKLFDKNNIIAGKYDSGNIYARGYYHNSDLLIDRITDVINSLAETCTNLQGFLIFRALGGGTGSGLGTQIMEHLDYCFPKILKYEFDIFPSPIISSSMVEAYNAILTTHATMELSDCTIYVDNDCVHEICLNTLDLDGPGYKHLNQIIGQVISAFTSSFRFPNITNCKYKEINWKLVPYPMVHFPIISYAPFSLSKKGDIENLPCNKLTNLLFEPKYQLLKCNQTNLRYFAAILLYRGNLTLTDINETIEELKSKKTNFINLKEFKYCLNNIPPIQLADSPLTLTANDVCLLGHNCGIRQVWFPIIQKFNKMYRKKAYLYHYLTEGLTKLEFEESKNTVCSLMDEYKDLSDGSVQFLRHELPDSNIHQL